VFVWDDAYFLSEGYSLKRLVFIYELLAGLDITCLKGDTAAVLKDYAKGRKIFVPKTPNPKFIAIMSHLDDAVIVPDTPLVIVPDDVDLKRFFRFWKRAKKSALSSSVGPLL